VLLWPLLLRLVSGRNSLLLLLLLPTLKSVGLWERCGL
jgi:hypothetical protein